jgi:hypothetical protein
MNIYGLIRQATWLSAVAATLASCGGAQTGSVPGTASYAQSPMAKRGSWVKPGTSNGPLLYVGGNAPSTGDVTFMLSYPDGNLVGTLDDIGEGMCSDAAGNVYLTHQNSVTEYAHGGTTALRTLRVPGADMFNCSVDPTTGNVAVTFSCPPCGYQDLAIFPPGSGSPTRYVTGSAWTCGYDGSGNLFINDSLGTELTELPNGSNSLVTLTLDKSIGYIGQVQWDGKNMTLQQLNNPGWIYRFSVSGSTAHIMTATKIKTDIDRTNPSWIYQNILVITFDKHDTTPDEFGIWRYPRGGHAIRIVKKLPNGGIVFGAVTISAPPSGKLGKVGT